MVQLKELLSSNFLCRRPSQAAASLWPRSLSSRLATGASGNHFNRDLYLALGRVHLLPAIVEEGGVAIKLNAGICSALGSFTIYNSQRGQRQPSNSTEKSAQPWVRFTYHPQQSKMAASVIKSNRDLLSPTLGSLTSCNRQRYQRQLSNSIDICSTLCRFHLQSAMAKEGSVSYRIQQRYVLSLGWLYLHTTTVKEGGISHQIQQRDLLSLGFTYFLQRPKRETSAIKFNRKIYSTFSQIHLHTAPVKERGVSNQIQQRDLLNLKLSLPTSYNSQKKATLAIKFNRKICLALGTYCNKQRGSVSYQIQQRDLLEFTYNVQYSKTTVLIIKFNRGIYSALGQVHLPPAIVKEGTISY